MRWPLSSKRACWLLTGCVLLTCLGSAPAAETDDELFDWLLAPDMPSSLNLSISLNDDSRGYTLGYSYDADQLGQFSIIGNRSHTDSNSPDNDSQQWRLGWDSDAFGPWTIGLSAGGWQTDTLLDTRDYAASLAWWADRFSFHLTPGWRHVKLSLPNGSRSTHAASLGATVRITDFSVGLTRYDYSQDLKRLGRLLDHRFRRVPASALDLLLTLEKQRLSFDYRVPLQQSDIGLRFDRSTSALTDEDLDLATGYVDFNINTRWDGLLEIGHASQKGGGTAVASLGVGYHW